MIKHGKDNLIQIFDLGLYVSTRVPFRVISYFPRTCQKVPESKKDFCEYLHGIAEKIETIPLMKKKLNLKISCYRPFKEF